MLIVSAAFSKVEQEAFAAAAMELSAAMIGMEEAAALKKSLIGRIFAAHVADDLLQDRAPKSLLHEHATLLFLKYRVSQVLLHL